MSNEFDVMMEKLANLQNLQYKPVENKQGELFDAPEIKVPKIPKAPKIPRLKLDRHDNEKRPKMHHDDKFNSPYAK